MILGCNCGHYDYMDLNIAYEFSKKITGVAIASDGTVSINYSKKQLILKSIADKDFLTFCRRKRANIGWIMYEYKNKRSYVTTLQFKNLYLSSLITNLKFRKKF